MDYKVYYEMWQMECCGEPFSVGDTVKWLVQKAEFIDMPIDVSDIPYCYQAHSSEWKKLFVLEGKVKRIEVLYQTYKRSNTDSRWLDSVSGELKEADNACGNEGGWDGPTKASGYVVVLQEATVRRAKKSEVTFC